MRKRKGKVFQKLALTLSAAFLLTGCNAVKTGSPDDYATNKGYEQSEGDTAQKGEGGISIRSAFFICPIRMREVVIPTRMIWV